MTVPNDGLKDRLDVPHIVQKIRAHDVIERFIQVELMGVCHEKVDFRVLDSGLLDQRSAEIYTNAVGGLQRTEQVPAAAAEFEDAHSRRDNKRIQFREPVLIIGATALPPREGLRVLGPVPDTLVCVGLKLSGVV